MGSLLKRIFAPNNEQLNWGHVGGLGALLTTLLQSPEAQVFVQQALTHRWGPVVLLAAGLLLGAKAEQQTPPEK